MSRRASTKHAPASFWHKPVGEKVYHYYRPSGMSACHVWQIVGVGLPTSATVRQPKRSCVQCVRAAKP